MQRASEKMDLPEENPKPEESIHSNEAFPEEPVLPEGFTPLGDLARLPRARRRRARRKLAPPGADERATLLDQLARRAFPSFEFFLFALLCGGILGAAYLLNAPALLLLGILLAPLLTPWVGMTLAVVTGSWRFFFLTLGGLGVAGALVFLTGALAGLAGRLWQNLPLFYARIYAQLWWPDLLVIVLGAALLAISFIRSEQKPVLASALLAYGFFLPISSAGIGLGLGKEVAGIALWPNGLLVFLVHLALAMLVGSIVLFAMHFKPVKAGGYILPIILVLFSLVGLFVLTGAVTLIRDGIASARHVVATPTTMSMPSSTPTIFQTRTPLPSPTLTTMLSPTLTSSPTPVYAMISASIQGGANLRTEPGSGTVIKVINNGLLVQVLPEVENIGTDPWVHVIAMNNLEGWILQSVLSPTLLVPTLPLENTIAPTP
jgi:hypothetical protein